VFKFIGAVVVYGFALYGVFEAFQEIDASITRRSGKSN